MLYLSSEKCFSLNGNKLKFLTMVNSYLKKKIATQFVIDNINL